MEKETLKLLIVDDEKEICEMMKLSFERRGYQVFTAGSAKETLPIIEKEDPQIMLLDRRLPDTNGIDLLRDIRKFNTRIKVIMVSADVLDDSIHLEIQYLNVFDYLCKPVDFSNLIETVKKASV